MGSRPLLAASCATLTPCRAAISESVSPGWTTYPPALANSGTPAPAAGEAAATSAAPGGGIISVEPLTSWAPDERPLAAASCATVRPSVAAIDESDSPAATT